MLTFTDRAREMVRAFMNQGDEGDLEALRIGVEGSPVAPRFELTLVSRGGTVTQRAGSHLFVIAWARHR